MSILVTMSNLVGRFRMRWAKRGQLEKSIEVEAS
jgi:hypothetical protein